jgi:hypothetical protein
VSEGIDPEVERQVVAALGGDPVPGRLVDAAAVVNDMVACTKLDAGSCLLLAAAVIRACRARGGSPTAARGALAGAWAVTSQADLLDVCAALAACAAAWGTDADLAGLVELGEGLP